MSIPHLPITKEITKFTPKPKVHLIKTNIILLLFLTTPNTSSAQKIDHLNSFRSIDSKKYFRFNYENDFFVHTDYNYTQGYNFEWVSPKLAQNPINLLLVKFANGNQQYGLTIEGIGFTPKDIVSFDIQLEDRPFSSATVIKSFVISDDREKHHRLSSGLSIGMIGPSTLGEETQVAIHKLTNSAIPNGWKHQIRNDFILNYQLDFEKELLAYRHAVINVDARVKLGTLFTNATLGGNLVLGRYQRVDDEASNQSFQIYGYIQPLLNLIGYDANLQGGILNNNSPYSIADKGINRATFQCNYGLIIKFRKLYLELSQTYLTKEFFAGKDVRWGSIRMGREF